MLTCFGHLVSQTNAPIETILRTEELERFGVAWGLEDGSRRLAGAAFAGAAWR
jgi:hypothetical protein